MILFFKMHSLTPVTHGILSASPEITQGQMTETEMLNFIFTIIYYI